MIGAREGSGLRSGPLFVCPNPALRIALPCVARYGGILPDLTHAPPGGLMPDCDCDATPEEVTAGIHDPDCIRHHLPADDPSDHYRQ